jgi:pyruvate/2-oxoglutarate dehydrogenase complex dihydrolipoamide dehydrogenase (E3) component
MNRFDIIVIGGGTAGLVTAAGAAALGLEVALVEREALGGDCLWTGCVPSKALIASAKLAHQMRHAERLGLTGSAPAHLFRTVMERMRKVRAQVAEHDDPERFRRLGIEVLFGEAEVRAQGSVLLDGKSLQSRRIVVATGSSPAIPGIPGLADAGYLTHLDAFDQDSLPSRLAILGAGPIGLEFAQVYSRLGAKVTLFEMLPRVLPRQDADVASVLMEALSEENISVHTGVTVDRIERCVDGTKMVRATDGTGESTSIEVDEVFVATGRRPNGGGLGLDRLGVELENGAVKVDSTLRSSVPGIWAAGDVAGGPQFTHVADYQAKLVLRNAVFPFASRTDYRAVPSVTYTDPEVAQVGLTEEEASRDYGNIRVYRYDFADLDRALVDGNTHGFVKIVTRKHGKIVGAHVVASGAGELIMLLALAMKKRMPLASLSRLVYPYPTMAEGIKRAADGYYRAKLAGTSGNLLRKVVRWLA